MTVENVRDQVTLRRSRDDDIVGEKGRIFEIYFCTSLFVMTKQPLMRSLGSVPLSSHTWSLLSGTLD
jgi:hypothetical protein